jgi:GNAT superfamily N-acetyltransferase
MEIRPITAAQARTVRLPVLRPGLPPEAAIFDHDDDLGTRHFGAFEGERLVGVATFFAETCPKRTESSAWRLRGMATLPEMQGRGAGRALVAEGVRVAKSSGASLMWCNARVTARGFYEKLGFVAVGDEFRLPVTGPHYMMMIERLSEPA